jgi:chitinase
VGHPRCIRKSDSFYSPFDKSQQPAGDKSDDIVTSVDVCEIPNIVSGIIHFWGLIDGGFLTNNGTSATGIDFDNCGQTVRQEAITSGSCFNLAFRKQSHFASGVM